MDDVRQVGGIGSVRRGKVVLIDLFYDVDGKLISKKIFLFSKSDEWNQAGVYQRIKSKIRLW